MNRQPVFYKLCAITTSGQSQQMPAVDPLAMKFLMLSEDEELDLADFYKHCLTAMLVGSSLDKAKKVCHSHQVILIKTDWLNWKVTL